MGEDTFENTSEAKPKKLKLGALSSETCAHWLHRKKRFCKMTVAKGNKFCGEHIEVEAGDAHTSEGALARIPCPLDSKHTVYKRNLQKHLKICNARPIEDQPVYIQKGINDGELEVEEENYANLKLSDLNEQELKAIVDKIKLIYKENVEGHIETSTAQHSSLDNELSNMEYGKETRKHLLQSAALLGILQEEHQLKESSSFIEFGAGKGQLAYYLAILLKDLQDSKVILLDRMSLRHKKDNKIQDRSLVQRIRVDIADFKMDQLELLRNTKRIVAFSKHLCGAATDLTLRCITQPKDVNVSETAPSTEFIMIALCCHHRCEWRSFVGKEFFTSQGLTQRDFVIMTKMVSWAICGTGMSRERRSALEVQSSAFEAKARNATHGLSLAERENIGFMCKRVLDIARLKYLQNFNYEAALKFYVSNDITLENVCLLAKRKVLNSS